MMEQFIKINLLAAIARQPTDEMKKWLSYPEIDIF